MYVHPLMQIFKRDNSKFRHYIFGNNWHKCGIFGMEKSKIKNVPGPKALSFDHDWVIKKH